MKKLFAMILALAMVLSLAACGGTAAKETEAPKAPETTPAADAPATDAPATEAPSSDVTVLGEGATTFYFSVVDLEGSETKYEIHTDETVVGAALLALGLIEGDEGEYGLYVNAVSGISADWDKDQTYWSFNIGGEYAMTGVDMTDIVAGESYSFVLTKG